MAPSPNLQRRLQQALGAEAAADLAAWMHGMDAHRGEIAELRQEMRAGFARMDAQFARIDERFAKIDERFAKIDERFAKIDERFVKVDERFARSDGRMDTMQVNMERIMERGLREQTRFFFLAWSVLLAAIIGLYPRI